MTNRDHSPSISQNDGGDAKLRTEGSGHTPGPWMAAAGPSSIVGWPVVAARGHSVCNLSWLGKKPDDVSDERFAEYRREVEANGRLIAAAPYLLQALRRLEKPAPGVKALPPWAVGIARAAIAKAEGRS